jgi:dephospho-CoA kinase
VPLVLGVLGGIASGKSAVARRLAGSEGVVLDADELARAALDEPSIRARVEAEFGLTHGPEGFDRAALAKLVFSSPGARARLEGWIHPRVRARILEALAEAEQRGTPRVVLDVPLLLENDPQHGLVSRCHHLVFVDAPARDRDRRAIESRGWEPGEVARREAAQLPLSTKRARADLSVENSGTLEELNAAVDRVLAQAGIV